MLVDSFVYIHRSMVASPLEGGRQGRKDGRVEKRREVCIQGKEIGRSAQMIRAYSCTVHTCKYYVGFCASVAYSHMTCFYASD